MKQIISIIFCFFVCFSLYPQRNEQITIERLFYTTGLSLAPNPGVSLEKNGNSLTTGDFDNKTLIAGLEGTINYHLIKKYFSVGASMMTTRTFSPNFNQLWLHADLRGYLSDEINTIYIFFRLGKAIPIGNLFLNGQGVGLGAGFRFKVLNQIFLADISLRIRTAQFDQKEWIPSDHKANAGGTFFGLSYVF